MNSNSAGFLLSPIPSSIWHDAHLISAFNSNFSQQVARFRSITCALPLRHHFHSCMFDKNILMTARTQTVRTSYVNKFT